MQKQLTKYKSNEFRWQLLDKIHEPGILIKDWGLCHTSSGEQPNHPPAIKAWRSNAPWKELVQSGNRFVKPFRSAKCKVQNAKWQQIGETFFDRLPLVLVSSSCTSVTNFSSNIQLWVLWMEGCRCLLVFWHCQVELKSCSTASLLPLRPPLAPLWPIFPSRNGRWTKRCQ